MIPIIKIEVTGQIEKILNSRRREVFNVRTLVTLQNGSTAIMDVDSEKKKSLLPYIDSMRDMAAKGRLKGEVHNGFITSTEEAYSTWG